MHWGVCHICTNFELLSKFWMGNEPGSWRKKGRHSADIPHSGKTEDRLRNASALDLCPIKSWRVMVLGRNFSIILEKNSVISINWLWMKPMERLIPSLNLDIGQITTRCGIRLTGSWNALIKLNKSWGRWEINPLPLQCEVQKSKEIKIWNVSELSGWVNSSSLPKWLNGALFLWSWLSQLFEMNVALS